MRRTIKIGAGWAFTMLCSVFAASSAAQTTSVGASTVPVLLVSDIHFEPFWDPAKVAQLAAAPAEGWKAILAAPDSAGRQQRFSDLEQSCHARGVDTSYPLFLSSLQAMRANAAGIRFVTLSGDLISHAFSCKFKTLFPQAAAADYQTFVEKTIEYVVGSLRKNFPGVPVYAALGNNDSDCGDYELDPHSEFLRETGKTMTADLGAEERKEALETFAEGGYYSAGLPAPFEHTRLLVLDDLFMARQYTTCAAKPDRTAAAAQIAWLRQQLERARSHHEHVWVMSHIPTGIDPYSTLLKGGNLCAGEAPQMFLSSQALTDVLASFGDVIQLAIFAHTHMDEMRLIEPDKKAAGHGPVAVKLVSSISPVDGNDPSFTVGAVDPSSGVLKDYRVFAASNQTGVDTQWTEEYDYAQAYREPSFSASSVANLLSEFSADPVAHSEASENYLRHYFVSDVSRQLKPFWPLYVCALAHYTEDSYRSCVCPKAP
ncbi:MAG TPA: metallophosphoesterase [Terracidiphilus sp.]|jgi:sphingomyelin phosphodiesterase acid-like 3